MKYIWIQVFNLVQKNDFWSYINDKILKLGNFLLKKKTTFFISSVNSKTPQDYQIPGARLWILFKKQYDDYFWSRE